MAENSPNTRIDNWASATTTRARIALEIASELVGAPDQPHRQAKVLLRQSGQSEWPICLFASSTIEGIDAVAAREASLAMINPAAILTLAYRGSPPFKGPQPVRAIGVIPSLDQYMFTVKAETGIKSFEDIAAKRYPLKIFVRAQTNHCLHVILGHVAEAAGFSIEQLKSWGGDIRYELQSRGVSRIETMERGGGDAVFEEAVHGWINEAIDAGMTILSLSETTLAKLEAMGYRRGIIRKSMFPKLANDIVTVDFSGWTVFVHAELPDELVTQMCAGLDARKHNIPWQGEGPLPVERMCHNEEDTPLDVPLHPAAEKFWKERGYLP